MRKFLLGLASLILLSSCFENIEELKNKNRIFRTENKYYVYYNGSTFELPKDLHLTKDKKIEQYFTTGILQKLNIDVVNKSELLNELNKYFPDGIDYITDEKQGKATVETPIMTLGNEKHIDSIKFEKLLSTLPTVSVSNQASEKIGTEVNSNFNPKESLKGKKIEILNANGIDGFAKKIGDKLKETYALDYNAENYSNPETMNYIITRKFNEAEVLAILEELGFKYARILIDDTIKSESDFVLITGNESKIKFILEIATLGDSSIITEKLKEYNPEIVKSVTFAEEPIEKMTQIQVVYNKVDLYTAKLMAKKIGGNVKLVESNKMNNRIVVVSKN